MADGHFNSSPGGRWYVVLAALVLYLLAVALSFDPETAEAATCPPEAPIVGMYDWVFNSEVRTIKSQITSQGTEGWGFGISDQSFHNSYKGYTHFHSGVDWRMSEGTPLYSPFSGKVVQFDEASGNRAISLTTSTGVKFMFYHLSERVASGSVSGGDLLGYSGNTGYSTTPHLHLEAFDGSGNLVHPEHWSCRAGGATGTGSTGDFTDTFDGSGALPSPPWTQHTGSATQASGRVTLAATSMATRPVTSGNGQVHAQFNTYLNSQSILFRYVDTGNFMQVVCLNTALELYKRVGGTATKLGGSSACKAGETYGAIFDGSTVSVVRNGVVEFSVTDSTHATAARVGLRNNDTSLSATFDNLKYLASTDVADSTGSTQTESGGASMWNPMAWLWDKLRGVLVPSPGDWVEINAALQPLLDKEPIGTMRDVAGFLGGVKGQLTATPAGGAPNVTVPSVAGGGLSLGPFTVASIFAGMVGFNASVTAALDQVTAGGLSGMQVFRAMADVFVAYSVFAYLRGRVVFAA